MAEERLKRAVFDAMRDSCLKTISPSDIARHSGLSRSLVYKHFGSLDALVLQAIKGKISFPPIEGLVGVKSAGKGALDRSLAAFDELSDRLEPELVDLLAWSFGNTDPVAVAVMKALQSYCKSLATDVGGDIALAPLFLGRFSEYVSTQQRAPSKDNLD